MGEVRGRVSQRVAPSRLAIMLGVIAATMCGISCADKGAALSPNAFGERYSSETDAGTRMSMVVKAIDDGLIRCGTPMSEMHTMLGGDPIIGPEVSEPQSKVYYFQPPRQSTQPRMTPPASPATPEGWYFVVWHDRQEVLKYYLTNIHTR